MLHLFTETDPKHLATMYKNIAAGNLDEDPLLQCINRYIPLDFPASPIHHPSSPLSSKILNSLNELASIAQKESNKAKKAIQNAQMQAKKVSASSSESEKIAENAPLSELVSKIFNITCQVCDQYLAHYLYTSPYGDSENSLHYFLPLPPNKRVETQFMQLGINNVTELLPKAFTSDLKNFLLFSFLYLYSVYQEYILPSSGIDAGLQFSSRGEKIADNPDRFYEDYTKNQETHSSFLDDFTSLSGKSASMSAKKHPFFASPFDVDFIVNIFHTKSQRDSLFNAYTGPYRLKKSQEVYNGSYWLKKTEGGRSFFNVTTFLKKYSRLFIPGDAAPAYLPDYLSEVFGGNSSDQKWILDAIPKFNQYILERLTSINYTNALFKSKLSKILPNLRLYSQYPLLSYRLTLLRQIKEWIKAEGVSYDKKTGDFFTDPARFLQNNKALHFSLNYQIYFLFPLMETIFSYIAFFIINQNASLAPSFIHALANALPSENNLFQKTDASMERNTREKSIRPTNNFPATRGEQQDKFALLYYETFGSFYNACTHHQPAYLFFDPGQATFDAINYQRLEQYFDRHIFNNPIWDPMIRVSDEDFPTHSTDNQHIQVSVIFNDSDSKK